MNNIDFHTGKEVTNRYYLKIELARDFCKAHNISMNEFLELEKKYNIFDFMDRHIFDLDYLTANEIVKVVDNLIKGVGYSAFSY